MNYIVDNLTKLADLLDKSGEHNAADEIDELIKSAAEGDDEHYEKEYLNLEKDRLEKEFDVLKGQLKSLREQEREPEFAGGLEYDKDTVEKNNELVDQLKYKMNEIEKIDKELSSTAPAVKIPYDDEQLYDNISQGSTKKTIDMLVEMADGLDKQGARDAANKIDDFIEKYARYATDVKWQDEKDTEQSKRYDSKYHHDLQVKEPKELHKNGPDQHHVETYQPSNGSLSTRYCPEHIGAQLSRVGEGVFQCSIDNAIYNWENGWTDYEGKQHPGGSIANQTPDATGYGIPNQVFDSREQIINRVN